MKVVVRKPGQNPERKEIENDLKVLQEIVGGLIEHITIYKEGEDWFGMLCNEEGKLIGLEPNFKLYTETIVGTVVFVGHDGEDFGDLPEDAYELLMDPGSYRLEDKKRPSEWRIAHQGAGGEIYIRVYRLRDISKPDHSGNREYLRAIFETDEEAQKVVDEMNSYSRKGGQ